MKNTIGNTKTKDISQYLHLYLGCQCQAKYYYGKDWLHVKLTGNVLAELEQTEGFTYQIEFIKPELRPLSDMTEEEAIEHIHISNEQGVYDGFRYWLSKHFDLFNLIPEGLALDATTLKK